MKRTPVWFWIAIAYLCATVAYNVSGQWSSFPEYALPDQIAIGSNLFIKSVAILFLLFRKRYGVYLLLAAFIIGLSDTVFQFYKDGTWTGLPILAKIGRVNGFVISAAIILYMASLGKCGLFNSRSASDLTSSTAATFD